MKKYKQVGGRNKVVDSVIDEIHSQLPEEAEVVDDSTVKDYLRLQFLTLWKKFDRCGRRWASFNKKYEFELQREIRIVIKDVDVHPNKKSVKRKRTPSPPIEDDPLFIPTKKVRRVMLLPADHDEELLKAATKKADRCGASSKKTFSVQQAATMFSKYELSAENYQHLKSVCAGIGHDIFPSYVRVSKYQEKKNLPVTAKEAVLLFEESDED